MKSLHWTGLQKPGELGAIELNRLATEASVVSVLIYNDVDGQVPVSMKVQVVKVLGSAVVLRNVYSAETFEVSIAKIRSTREIRRALEGENWFLRLLDKISWF